jgi:hypothetical protein
MMVTVAPKLVFEEAFDERRAFEATARGYLGDTVVELPDGTCYAVVFYDPVRLQQDLEEELAQGNPYIAEPGMIVVPEVTLGNMEQAVANLYREGFFSSFVSRC